MFFQTRELIPTGAGSSWTNVNANAISSSMAFTGGSLSVMCWFNTIATGANIFLCTGNNGAGDQLFQLRLVNGILQFNVTDSGNVFHAANGVGDLRNGKTHFVVGVYDGTTMTLYVDNAVNGVPVSPAFTMRNGNWGVGIASLVSGSGNVINGPIEHVSGYLRAVTAAEINTLWLAATTLT